MAQKEVVENFGALVSALEMKNKPSKSIEPIKAQEKGWSLYENDKELAPLQFSNGKTQEDVVEEVVNAIKNGSKIVFIHGVCGTGKSAIALNIARKLGRASIVVPVKALQKQYEEDYMSRKYVLKANGQKLKIAMITGRENHDSIIKPGLTCADPTLPDTIKLNDRNWPFIQEYYEKNPYIKNKSAPSLKHIKRISIAPANPYWSPILPAQFELDMPDAKKRRYVGLDKTEFIFYQRKQGCGYYDQYAAYLDADVIMFNAAKYKIETLNNKKPATDVEIIDEADEFLDNLSEQQSLNLSRLALTLGGITPLHEQTQEALDTIKDAIRNEERKIAALGINDQLIVPINDTNVSTILTRLLESPDIEDEARVDEATYIAQALEVARSFGGFLDETFLTYRKYDNDLVVDIITTNISKRFADIVKKNKALVLMSGTLHSPEVLRDVFGIQNPTIIEAESKAPGTIEIIRTGKEFDCKYSNFESKKNSREQYVQALGACWAKAPRPTLVHVNAFEDLPSIEETYTHNVQHVMSKEQLRELQANDKNGRLISLFKSRLNDMLVTTKCSRGVDFPGDMCNAIIFTKYPNPNPRDIFWKILQRTHPNYFWECYRDKARREFLQRIYRALRTPTDHVYVLSPDTRVLEAVREMQTMH